MKQARELQTTTKVNEHELCQMQNQQEYGRRKSLRGVSQRVTGKISQNEIQRCFGRSRSYPVIERLRGIILTAKGRKCRFLRGFDCKTLPASSSTSSSEGSRKQTLSHFHKKFWEVEKNGK